jgi:endonuclease YncB( thermonuclease family)
MIDGDTIEIHGQGIRLHGIDTPEDGQTCDDASGKPYRCGQVAALALADKIGAGTVACEQRDTDRYGRIVAVCR